MYLPLQLDVDAEFRCENGSTDFEIRCGCGGVDAARAARRNTPSGRQGNSVRFVLTRSAGFFSRVFTAKLDGHEVELCLFALTHGGMNVWWRLPGVSGTRDSWISPPAEELGMHGEHTHNVVMVTSAGGRIHVHIKYKVGDVSVA